MYINRKIQLKGGKKRGRWLVICISFLVGISVFFLLINTEKKALSDYQTKEVVLAKCNIKAGTCIEKTELEDYFMSASVNVAYAVSDFSSLDQIDAWIEDGDCVIVCTNLKEKEQIYKEKMICPDHAADDFKEAVVTCLKMESYEYSVGGTLRAGDYIDVSIVNLENEAETILEDVLIVKAFDVNGNEILPENPSAVGVGFNILVEKEQLKQYQAAIENGIVRLTKKF